MGYAEKRGSGANTYYLARFSDGGGKWPTLKDDQGRAVRFKRKREAEKAAGDEEAKVRGGRYHDPARGRLTFGAWVGYWHAAQDLAPTTMQNVQRRIETHLLPAFGESALADILPSDVDAWEREEREAGYKESSIRTWRTLLHTIMADAADGHQVDRILGTANRQGLIEYNPVTQRRGRGRRAGRSAHRTAEKVITNPLGALLLAERAAILSGRDDEFVMVTTKYYTGLRWAELTGLQTQYFRLSTIRVESELVELDNGTFVACPPKDDSYRDVDLPRFLSDLISAHLTRTAPTKCACHGSAYVFRGRGRERSAVKIGAVAERAGVSVGTVSNVLNRPERVADATRARVEEAIAALGFAGRSAPTAAPALHWRRSGFETWIFRPAADGWFPKRSAGAARPVPLKAEPWPGVPVRGRAAQERAEMSWTPIARGLTPHGLRHSHKSLMVQLRTPEVLSHERLGHILGGIGGVYSHVTPEMREELRDALTQQWEAALDARLELSPHSPVAVLEEILQARRRHKKVGRPEDRPTEFPQEGVVLLRSRPRKGA
ncbi:LacI family DNA-binding transcriptional regulator [Actinoallomurus spadix]|uniref:LacI family transcriptional regulator n=1 Tax=Actinoallomurus spadix TaxID=79912 RepID=A0ABN0WVC1_9ACTN